MKEWRDENGGWPALVSNVWRMQPEQRNGQPAPFPIDLPTRAIRLSTWPGETVFDPFCGGGSTLRAAKDLGRKRSGWRSRKSSVSRPRGDSLRVFCFEIS